MDILVITDSPVIHGHNNTGFGSVATVGAKVEIMFAEDIINDSHRTRGRRFNIVMIPTSIADVCDVNNPISIFADDATKTIDGDIIYY